MHRIDMDWIIKVAFSGFYLILVLALLGLASCNGEPRADRGPEAPHSPDDAQTTVYEGAEGMYTAEVQGVDVTLVLERPGTAKWYHGEPGPAQVEQQGTWDEDDQTVRVHLLEGVEEAEGQSLVLRKEGHRLVGETYDREAYGDGLVLQREGDAYTLPVEQENDHQY